MQATIHYPTLRTYRSPSEIAKDMAGIIHSIREIEGRLVLRDLLVESLYRSGDAGAEVAAKLHAALEDARDALSGIGALREELLLLEEELEVCRCHRV